MEKEHLKILIQGYLRGELGPAELQELISLMDKDEYQEFFKQEIGKALQEDPGDAELGPDAEERIFNSILNSDREQRETADRRIPTYMLKAGIAASIVTIIAVTAYYIGIDDKKPVKTASPVASTIRVVPKIKAEDKVTLTLSDGSVILLEEVSDGAIVTNAGSVIKQKGVVDYTAVGVFAKAEVFNTISTPRGSRYHILLSDGTGVWLNAASSIRFPVVFGKGERRVEVTGQAYFEVAKNKDKPFRVKVRDAEVEVLGTHFDIMAYDDERNMVTTLLEGSVKFSRGLQQALLRPGQQSAAGAEGPIRIGDNVDVSKVVAWKEGFVEFNGADIGTVCRTLSRSYDIMLDYDESIRELFFAKFPLQTKLSVVLKALEMTGKVRFDEKNGKVHARP
jgi:hypothetical protein